MRQALLKEVPKRKEWPHFSGEGQYDHMKSIRGIEMIKEYFELPERFVAENSTPCLPNKLIDGLSNQQNHMNTKVVLGAKPKLLINKPIMLGDLK
ncbi:hypothetical protein O181_069385 [Austropuccinia psidii MF-1]|uniref:Uncharacterized protein n=1 Tax=Austropuccinia psidii MF-1 TaxID=1389203 RepID=A0A9Q3F2W4_9BASI|nr:hypothetical protein [Austropuccinia psidii MF-1]